MSVPPTMYAEKMKAGSGFRLCTCSHNSGWTHLSSRYSSRSTRRTVTHVRATYETRGIIRKLLISRERVERTMQILIAKDVMQRRCYIIDMTIRVMNIRMSMRVRM